MNHWMVPSSMAMGLTTGIQSDKLLRAGLANLTFELVGSGGVAN